MEKQNVGMIQGTSQWAKLVRPGKAYNEGEFEWSVDLYIDDKTVQKLTEEGVGKTIKEKDDKKFITFKRRTKNKDGSDAKPIKLVDNKGQPWDPEKLIGNGSILNVRYAVNETTFGKKTFVKASPLAIQVWDLVAYEGKGDFEEFPTAANESWT